MPPGAEAPHVFGAEGRGPEGPLYQDLTKGGAPTEPEQGGDKTEQGGAPTEPEKSGAQSKIR